MVRPLLLLIYLVIWIPKVCCFGSRRHIRVNMGFSDKDKILTENFYILKVTEQENFRNFQIKVGYCSDWTNWWKSCGFFCCFIVVLLLIFFALTAYGIYFFYSVIFILKLGIKKGMSFGCKFSQLQCYQLLLKLVNIWPSNHKNKKNKLFWDTVYVLPSGKK